MIKAQPALHALRPRKYTSVAYAAGTIGSGMLLHRGVDALKVPGGFLVQVFQYVSDPTPRTRIATGPGPSHTATFFMPVETLQEVQDAFFEEKAEQS